MERLSRSSSLPQARREAVSAYRSGKRPDQMMRLATKKLSNKDIESVAELVRVYLEGGLGQADAQGEEDNVPVGS